MTIDAPSIVKLAGSLAGAVLPHIFPKADKTKIQSAVTTIEGVLTTAVTDSVSLVTDFKTLVDACKTPAVPIPPAPLAPTV